MQTESLRDTRYTTLYKVYERTPDGKTKLVFNETDILSLCERMGRYARENPQSIVFYDAFAQPV